MKYILVLLFLVGCDVKTQCDNECKPKEVDLEKSQLATIDKAGKCVCK